MSQLTIKIAVGVNIELSGDSKEVKELYESLIKHDISALQTIGAKSSTPAASPKDVGKQAKISDELSRAQVNQLKDFLNDKSEVITSKTNKYLLTMYWITHHTKLNALKTDYYKKLITRIDMGEGISSSTIPYLLGKKKYIQREARGAYSLSKAGYDYIVQEAQIRTF